MSLAEVVPLKCSAMKVAVNSLNEEFVPLLSLLYFAENEADRDLKGQDIHT